MFVLPGRSEDAAAAALEALAAGTPVLAGEECALELAGSEFALRKARRDDVRAQKKAMLDLLDAAPSRERVRELARPYSWDNVALQLARCYFDVAAGRRPAALQGPCPSKESYTAR